MRRFDHPWVKSYFSGRRAHAPPSGAERMETKANTALIGGLHARRAWRFGFVFVYWLARGAGEGAPTPT